MDHQVFILSNRQFGLPNIDTLKFFYKAEKELDEIISLFSQFGNCHNSEAKTCAIAAQKYFQFQKDFFISVRDLDYRNLKVKDIPHRIPPEILRANAKLLEQRDQMVQSLVSFYEGFAADNKKA